MKAKRLSADTLIEIAIITLKRDLLADAAADQRYAGAMIVNALEIARREITSDGETPQWQLLDQLYDDGEGSLQQLARDIRTGRIDEAKHPDLAARLRELVIAELRTANPRFLSSRGIGGDPAR
jgi:hypothetical protein